MSGPTEFAALPREDRLFWDAWFREVCRRAAEHAESSDHDRVETPAAFLANL